MVMPRQKKTKEKVSCSLIDQSDEKTFTYLALGHVGIHKIRQQAGREG
jgi:hypothetical protein